jgi:putative transposase
VIEHFGIQFCGLRYNTQDLTSLRLRLKSEKVKIKYDPADLEYIFVYDPQEKIYLQVKSLDPEYTHGLSLWKHRVIRSLARKEQDKVDILGLARAKRHIQEIVQESKSGGKSKSRVRIARWETGESVSSTSVQTVLPPPTPQLLQPVASAQLPSPIVNISELEQKGWSAGYDLPIEKP